MTDALQCPACGYKHRLDTIPPDPLFGCAGCGRTLKTPPAYIRRVHAASADRWEDVATGDDAGVLRGGAAASRAVSGAAVSGATANGVHVRKAASSPAHGYGFLTVPLRLLAWVVAVGVGAAITLVGARAVGWIDSSNLFDVIAGQGFGRYVHVFALVPVWALVTAVLVSAFIEGIRSVQRRRHGSGPRRVEQTHRPADAGLSSPGPSAPSSAPSSTRLPERERETVPPGGDQRERRIPRRGTGS